MHAQSLPEPIRFTVRAIPTAKPRHRSFVYRDRFTGKPRVGTHMADASEKLTSEFIALADPYAPEKPYAGPLELSVTFTLQMPKSGSQKWHDLAAVGEIHHIKKPDTDNLLKQLIDCLSRSGRWWIDDDQIVEIRARKQYGAAPQTDVELFFLVDADSSMRRTAAARVVPDQAALL